MNVEQFKASLESYAQAERREGARLKYLAATMERRAGLAQGLTEALPTGFDTSCQSTQLPLGFASRLAYLQQQVRRSIYAVAPYLRTMFAQRQHRRNEGR